MLPTDCVFEGVLQSFEVHAEPTIGGRTIGPPVIDATFWLEGGRRIAVQLPGTESIALDLSRAMHDNARLRITISVERIDALAAE